MQPKYAAHVAGGLLFLFLQILCIDGEQRVERVLGLGLSAGLALALNARCSALAALALSSLERIAARTSRDSGALCVVACRRASSRASAIVMPPAPTFPIGRRTRLPSSAVYR